MVITICICLRRIRIIQILLTFSSVRQPLGGYLLTHKDEMFDRDTACQLISQLIAGRDSGTLVELPRPAILKPRVLWTGKQIFSLILKPSRESNVRINLRAKNKKYTKSR